MMIPIEEDRYENVTAFEMDCAENLAYMFYRIFLVHAAGSLLMQKHDIDELMLEVGYGLDVFDVGIMAIEEGIFETISKSEVSHALAKREI
jgi:hypothetical protein